MKRTLLVGLLLAAAFLAHLGFWYWPRERAAAPDPASSLVKLFESGDYTTCAWVPYPHQNLGAFAHAAPDWPRFLAAVARLAGAGAPDELRSFGPFAVPPSHELIACVDRGGGRMRIAARVYPGLGLLARLAGRLAANPWLAGGEVGRFRVGWEGGVWTVEAGGAAPPPALPTAAPAERRPSLAVIHLTAPLAGVSAGTFVLARRGAGFELSSAGPPRPLPALAATTTELPVLLVLRSAAAEDAASGPQAPSAFALFRRASALWSGRLGGRTLRVELPGTATFEALGSGRQGVLAGGLARFLAGRPPSQEVGGWTVRALDAETLAAAAALAPQLAALGAPQNGLGLAVWVDPRAALDVVTRVREILAAFPFTSSAEVQRWRDGEALLAPFARCASASFFSWRDASGGLLMRLDECGVR
jgi:hypothetical protein